MALRTLEDYKDIPDTNLAQWYVTIASGIDEEKFNDLTWWLDWLKYVATHTDRREMSMDYFAKMLDFIVYHIKKILLKGDKL